MRKSILFVAALAVLFTACEPNEPSKKLKVASFENITLAADTVYYLDSTSTFESGDFFFTQDVQDYGDWGVYYFGNVLTNKTGKEYKGDTQNYMSASGGAHSGKNFVVWYPSFMGDDGVTLKKAAVVPGFYVNNTPWVVDAILNGDGMSDDGGLPFDSTDFFTLKINGFLDGKAVNNEVTVDLAKGTEYIKDWTYVSLEELGIVDALKFSLYSSKQNSGGITTPTYFAFDDLGAKK